MPAGDFRRTTAGWLASLRGSPHDAGVRSVSIRTKYLALYTGTVVLTQLAVALPGLPEPASPRTRDTWLAIHALLLLFLWRGSAVAWALSLLLAVLPAGTALFVLGDVPEPGVLAGFALALVGAYALVRLPDNGRARTKEGGQSRPLHL